MYAWSIGVSPVRRVNISRAGPCETTERCRDKSASFWYRLNEVIIYLGRLNKLEHYNVCIYQFDVIYILGELYTCIYIYICICVDVYIYTFVCIYRIQYIISYSIISYEFILCFISYYIILYYILLYHIIMYII